MPIETKKFVRKPLYVDAVQVTPTNFDEIATWCQGQIQQDSGPRGKRYIRVRVLQPKTPRQSKAYVGDWLLYTEQGYKVYTSQAFHAAFDLVKIITDISNASIDFVLNGVILPKFYNDPETGFLTDEKPHEKAVALTVEELMEIIRVEIHSERHCERIEEQKLSMKIAKEGTPDPQLIDELLQTKEQRASYTVDSAPKQEKVEPSAVEGKRVLSMQECKELTAEEIRGLIQSGEAVLAQDVAKPQNKIVTLDKAYQQRLEALKNADHIRLFRSQLKKDLKSGKVDARKILRNSPEEITTMKIVNLLLAIPNLGETRANKILQKYYILPTKKVGKLTDNQREMLVKALTKIT